jgi:hypothetical protein
MEIPPVTARCNSCGTTADVLGGSPDKSVQCDCCPEDHDHDGLCRPLTITAFAYLLGEVTVLWQCLTRPAPAIFLRYC